MTTMSEVKPTPLPPALRDVAKLYAKYDALYKAQQPQAKPHKPLFADLIAQHPGLREELLEMDKQPQAEAACNPHPKAPHGFNRNASHNAGRYVCDCEGWDAWDAGYSEGRQVGFDADAGQQAEAVPSDVQNKLNYCKECGSKINKQIPVLLKGE